MGKEKTLTGDLKFKSERLKKIDSKDSKEIPIVRDLFASWVLKLNFYTKIASWVLKLNFCKQKLLPEF